MANMTIHWFKYSLERNGKLAKYGDLLMSKFNPHAANSVMCRNLVSISWGGFIYDCDFNQMLELPSSESRTNVWDVESFDYLAEVPIVFTDRCFGCTAGAGSSCGGK